MNKKLNKFLGFTLAELMVVLAILGVISAILLPTVFDSMPDENRLKFKKGYYTLKRTIDLMVNSEAYNSTKGQFGKIVPAPAEGGSVQLVAPDYFCVQFSQALNTVEAQCSTFALNGKGRLENGGAGPNGNAGIIVASIAATEISNPDTGVDKICSQIQADTLPNVVTQDGISWFLPYDSFSFYDTDDGAKDLKVGDVTYGNIPAYHSTVCMDVDDVHSGQPPFGFGIRIDGRVVAGAKAIEWLKEGTKKMLTDEDD